MSCDVPVLTLDGPSGSGKGVIARTLSRKLNWRYLESGALYRVLGLLAERRGIDLKNVDGLVGVADNLVLGFDDGNILLNDGEIGAEIDTEHAGRLASAVARIPEVRAALLDCQRQCARPPGLVAEGRDMGTVVFPAAGCKIFLTASAEARAQRRFNQLRKKGFDVNIPQLSREISERDQRDANRSASPLRPAADAFRLDTTDLSIDEVVAAVWERVALVYPVS